MRHKLCVGLVILMGLLSVRNASAVTIGATNLDTWILADAGAPIATMSDPILANVGSPPPIGVLDNVVYFNATTGNYTYAHQVTPFVLQNISELNTAFGLTDFIGTAGFSFSQSLAAGGAGNASDFEIEWESDQTMDWETLFGNTDGWDSPEAITFFFVSTAPPRLGDYNVINGRIGTATSFAPIPEPGSIALLGSGLIGLYASVRRRRRLKA
jgi:hypothetical protein